MKQRDLNSFGMVLQNVDFFPIIETIPLFFPPKKEHNENYLQSPRATRNSCAAVVGSMVTGSRSRALNRMLARYDCIYGSKVICSKRT